MWATSQIDFPVEVPEETQYSQDGPTRPKFLHVPLLLVPFNSLTFMKGRYWTRRIIYLEAAHHLTKLNTLQGLVTQADIAGETEAADSLTFL